MLNNQKDYIELSDGGKWYPAYENPKPSPEIIAHGLGNLCRFTGHAKFFYSVAEHCVKCSYLVPEEFAFEALLHDAHEIYTNDLAKPIKSIIEGSYSELEEIAEIELRTQYGLKPHISPEVKWADRVMVLIEAMDLLPSGGKEWDYLHPWYAEARRICHDAPWYRPQGWDPTLSYPLTKAWNGSRHWLERYKELTGG